MGVQSHCMNVVYYVISSLSTVVQCTMGTGYLVDATSELTKIILCQVGSFLLLFFGILRSFHFCSPLHGDTTHEAHVGLL